jgi:carboxyl-terminal processing protease
MKCAKFFILSILILLNAANGFAQTNEPLKLNSPENNFEIFWQTFRDNYAFFALKKVNWDNQYKIFRPKVTAKTNEKELVEILVEMVEPLQDGHITITKKDEVLFTGKSRKNYFRNEFSGIEKEFWQNSDDFLLSNVFEKITPLGSLGRNYHPFYFTKSKDIGYIRITRMFVELSGILGDEKDQQKDQKELLRLLDEIVEKFKDCWAVIIDLRSNGGGHSGYEMAGRFALEKTLTHYKAIRTAGGYENLTEPIPFYVVPSEGVRFTKPIVILTSDRTASAAEDFVLSLYQQANVTVIGDTTKGMFSDTYNAKLPNGIEFSLSNQRYLDTEKQILEDKGVHPKFIVKNSKQDIENRKDVVIKKAIESLENLFGQNFKTSNPDEIKIVTSDIPNFWLMYDKLQKAPNKAESLKIIQSEYLDKGSDGLREYVKASHSTAESFYYAFKRYPKVLASLRKSTLQIDRYKKNIIKSAKKLKAVYPEAVFPAYYFVIGKFESGGSQFENFLYIGAEIVCLADDAPLEEFGELKNNVGYLKDIENVAIHETIHYQQINQNPTTNLEGALIEGGAEFAATKITGKFYLRKIAKLLTTQQMQEVEAEFFAEKNAPINPYWFLAKYDAVKKRPAPLGYLIGFNICEKFYHQAKDKKAALRTIIKMEKDNEIQRLYEK